MRILSFISHGDESGALANQIAQQAKRAGEGEVAVIRVSPGQAANDAEGAPDADAPKRICRDVADLLPELERQYHDGLALAVIDTSAGEPDATEQAIAYSDLIAIPTVPDTAQLDSVKGTLDAVEMQAKPFVFIINVPSSDPDPDASAETAIVLCQYGTVSPVTVSQTGEMTPDTAANEDPSGPGGASDDSEIAQLWDYLRARLHKVAPADSGAAETDDTSGAEPPDSAENRRRYRRWAIDTLAQLTVNGDVSKCTVANISGGGALIKTDAKANLGDVLFVTDPTLGDFEAEVRHVGADNTFGVEFVIDPKSKDKLAKQLEKIAVPDDDRD